MALSKSYLQPGFSACPLIFTSRQSTFPVGYYRGHYLAPSESTFNGPVPRVMPGITPLMDVTINPCGAHQPTRGNVKPLLSLPMMNGPAKRKSNYYTFQHRGSKTQGKRARSTLTLPGGEELMSTT